MGASPERRKLGSQRIAELTSPEPLEAGEKTLRQLHCEDDTENYGDGCLEGIETGRGGEAELA